NTDLNFRMADQANQEQQRQIGNLANLDQQQLQRGLASLGMEQSQFGLNQGALQNYQQQLAQQQAQAVSRGQLNFSNDLAQLGAWQNMRQDPWGSLTARQSPNQNLNSQALGMAQQTATPNYMGFGDVSSLNNALTAQQAQVMMGLAGANNAATGGALGGIGGILGGLGGGGGGGGGGIFDKIGGFLGGIF